MVSHATIADLTDAARETDASDNFITAEDVQRVIHRRCEPAIRIASLQRDLEAERTCNRAHLARINRTDDATIARLTRNWPKRAPHPEIAVLTPLRRIHAATCPNQRGDSRPKRIL